MLQKSQAGKTADGKNSLWVELSFDMLRTARVREQKGKTQQRKTFSNLLKKHQSREGRQKSKPSAPPEGSRKLTLFGEGAGAQKESKNRYFCQGRASLKGKI